MNSVRRLAGRSLFLDANAAIYFLEGMTSPEADEIFMMACGPDPSIKFVTNAGIVDEIFFKMLVLRAKSRGIPKNTIAKLRRNKRNVIEIAPELEKVKNFLDRLNLNIEPVEKKDVYQVLPIMTEYGLFGKDALIVRTMRKFNMKFLLSSDRDFDSVSWIERVDPLREDMMQEVKYE